MTFLCCVAINEEESFQTLNYWLSRLEPATSTQGLHFLCADRIGVEDNDRLGKERTGQTKFSGNSCIIDVANKNLVDRLNATEENVGLFAFTVPT